MAWVRLSAVNWLTGEFVENPARICDLRFEKGKDPLPLPPRRGGGGEVESPGAGMRVCRFIPLPMNRDEHVPFPRLATGQNSGGQLFMAREAEIAIAREVEG